MARSDYPLIPLPDVGEGGPIPTFPAEDDLPAVPLPGPGEGGPLPTFPGGGEPVIPLPDPGEGGPLPSFPGGWLPGLIRPPAAHVRFLNGAYGYPAFRVLIEGRPVTRSLSYAALSGFERTAPGYRQITVSGPDGYVYIRRRLPFRPGSFSTVAVVNRPGGLELVQLGDLCCRPGGGWSELRLCNLAAGSRPMDMLLGDGRTVYADVQFKETTAFRRIRPGTYQFLFADTRQEAMPDYEDVETLDGAFVGLEPAPETAASLYLKVAPNRGYTVFLLTGGGPGQVLALSAEER